MAPDRDNSRLFRDCLSRGARFSRALYRGVRLHPPSGTYRLSGWSTSGAHSGFTRERTRQRFSGRAYQAKLVSIRQNSLPGPGVLRNSAHGAALTATSTVAERYADSDRIRARSICTASGMSAEDWRNRDNLRGTSMSVLVDSLVAAAHAAAAHPTAATAHLRPRRGRREAVVAARSAARRKR